MVGGETEGATLAHSPEAALANEDGLFEQEVVAPAIDMLERVVFAWVPLREVKHEETCQYLVVVARDGAQGLNKQIAGVSKEKRMMNERMVQMQVGIGKNAPAHETDIMDRRTQLSSLWCAAEATSRVSTVRRNEFLFR